MNTPLIMLILLAGPLGIAWLTAVMGGPRIRAHVAGTVGLALMFIFTASGHFLMADLMVEMLPPWVPARGALVFLTGLLELAIAAALLWPHTRWVAGWIAITALILFFPANIYAALNHVPMGGHAWGLRTC